LAMYKNNTELSIVNAYCFEHTKKKSSRQNSYSQLPIADFHHINVVLLMPYLGNTII
jgi:hypothetical protein